MGLLNKVRRVVSLTWVRGAVRLFPDPGKSDSFVVYTPTSWESRAVKRADEVYRDFGLALGGTPEVVAAHRGRFIDELAEASVRTGGAHVVEIGCGRGELLRLLRDRGVNGVGVDMNHAQVSRLGDEGLTAYEADANTYLEGVDDGSLGAVACFNVIEHVQPEYAVEYFRLLGSKIAPGGTALIQTSNPECPFEMGVFWVDPTHVKPYHPQTLAFFMAQSGFESVRIVYTDPAPIGLSVSGEQPGMYRSYAVIGRRAGGASN